MRGLVGIGAHRHRQPAVLAHGAREHLGIAIEPAQAGAVGRIERAAEPAARKKSATIDRYVAGLVPIYFGRVASFVIENRDITTDEAEERVERQAREFELLKPYLIERWKAE